MSGAFSLICIAACAAGDEWEPRGYLDHVALRECSGIVASRRHPGVFWTHNDSGNAPEIFAVGADGTCLRAFRVSALNIDWEDIAIDDKGRLYLGDIGNNLGLLPVRMIHVLDEPDPHRAGDEPLAVRGSYHYRFAEGDAFDAEALVVDGDRLLLIEKSLGRSPARIFAIPMGATTSLMAPLAPEPSGFLPDFTEPVTGADLTPDGRLLVACSYRVARVYEREEKEWRLAGAFTYPASAPIEAVCWIRRDWLLAGEDRALFRVRAATWQKGAQGRP